MRKYVVLGPPQSRQERSSARTAMPFSVVARCWTRSIGASHARQVCSSGLDGRCATSFGNALTDGFARIDGVVYALQMPNDQSCTMPNKDHLIVQVLMNGAVYRMVVNTDVKVATVEHAVPSPAFAEGWHTGVALDYPSILGAHSPSFVAKDMAGVVASVTSELHVGDPVSIYATSESYPDSAHLVHRNTNAQNVDGAIVAHPTTSPKFILFAFDNQTF